ncbi:DMT family transporter [Devosia sp. Root635]|uniref:DMT family transporter n=1 Tax=Devosia sp. Root635 TaxID=1736575 RepID=UPI0012E34188|nr:DMT family transporter [Devosia sp. Root635]
MRLNPILAGCLLMAVAAVVGVMDVIAVRLIDDRVHPFEIVFFRNLFSMAALMLLMPRPQWHLRGGGLWPLHIARAVLKLFALGASFIAIGQLPLATVTSIGFTTPVFAVIGAVLILGERVRWPQMVALLIGFGGVLVVVRPDVAAPDWNLLYAFASALALAAVMLLLKASADREDGRRVTWLNLVLSVPLAGLMCAPFWSNPAPLDLAIMAIQGVGGLLAQLSVSAAMRMGRASALIIVDFIRLPLAIGAGVLLFGETLDGPIIAGAALILVSLLLNGFVASRHRDVVTPPG